MITETQKDMVKQDELVKYALTHGIIDFDELEERVEAMRRKDYLKQHTSKIWQNEHGQWLTHDVGVESLRSYRFTPLCTLKISYKVVICYRMGLYTAD